MKKIIIDLLIEKELTFQEIRKKLEKKQKIDGRKLNDILRELNQENKIYFKFSNRKYYFKEAVYFTGIFKDTQRDFAFVENDEKSIFIPAKFTQNAFSGDLVKVLLFDSKKEDDKSFSGKVVRILKRNVANIIMLVKEENKKLNFILQDINQQRETVFENKNDFKNFKKDDIFVVKLIDLKDNKVFLKINKYIGNIKDPKIDFEILKYKHNIPSELNSKKYKDKIKSSEDNKRKDLTKLLTFTIDGSDSKDLDDAVSVEKIGKNYKLYVHIADVSHFIQEGEELDKEALERSNSIYLLNKVIPMLPKFLSNDICSLNPGTEKMTFTSEILFNENIEVLKHEVYTSKIISDYRLTYKEVDDFLIDKPKHKIEDKNLQEALKISEFISDELRKIKLKEGMIDFFLTESKLILDNEDQIESFYEKRQTKAEALIEDLMVVTNQNVAKLFAKSKLNSVFRVHKSPKLENIQKFIQFLNIFKKGELFPSESSKVTSKHFSKFLLNYEGEEEELELIKRYMIQTMEKAVYFKEDLGHYALGLNNYLHFTSPIRRYSDLVVHRLIKKFILNNKSNSLSKEEEGKLDSICAHISLKERETMSIERNYIDIKKSRFFEEKINTEFVGKIVSFSKNAIFVKIDQNFTGSIFIKDFFDEKKFQVDENKFFLKNSNNKKVLELNQEIKVSILEVDVLRGKIYLNLLK